MTNDSRKALIRAQADYRARIACASMMTFRFRGTTEGIGDG